MPYSRFAPDKSSLLCKIWNVARNQPYRWAANPRTNTDTCKNPTDLITDTHQALADLGEAVHIENHLMLLAEPFGFSIRRSSVKSDRQSTTMEILDLTEAIGNLAAHHRDAVADGRYTEEECQKDLRLLNEISTQVQEARDAILSRRP